jgi:hypothetical protein
MCVHARGSTGVCVFGSGGKGGGGGTLFCTARCASRSVLFPAHNRAALGAALRTMRAIAQHSPRPSWIGSVKDRIGSDKIRSDRIGAAEPSRAGPSLLRRSKLRTSDPSYPTKPDTRPLVCRLYRLVQ